jgi:hypothetical protein
MPLASLSPTALRQDAQITVPMVTSMPDTASRHAAALEGCWTQRGEPAMGEATVRHTLPCQVLRVPEELRKAKRLEGRGRGRLLDRQSRQL